MSLADDLRATARASARWLVDRVEADGQPRGATERNSWWRTPWSLAVAGERGVSAAVLDWVEREALDADADLKEGPARGTFPSSPVYHLSHIAIGAHLVGRYDLVKRLLVRLRYFQHPEMGGAFMFRDKRGEQQDMLLTTQLGQLATVVGDEEMAAGAYGWLRKMWSQQPDLGRGILYPVVSPSGPVTDFPAEAAYAYRVDFAAPRQACYHPGAAAAFLADYALWTGEQAPIDLAREMMQLNIEGSEEQFTDQQTVQICKFGWGAAELLTADPSGGWLPHAERMAQWFIDRQQPDGAWLPSTFMLNGEATDNDKMWKTAEHLMEAVMLETALSRTYSRDAAGAP